MFVEKFILMHKNCCNQSCFFWHRYAPNRLSAGACFAPDPTGGAYSAPPDPLAGLGGGTPGEREEGRRGEGGKRKEREERESRCDVRRLAVSDFELGMNVIVLLIYCDVRFCILVHFRCC